MKFYKNIVREVHLLDTRKMDVFGIGAATSGAMSLASTIYTNETNRAINDRQLEFAREEAEKSREFNSEEAEKARQWNSEQAVMERRKEAGINMINGGNVSTGSGGSSASASSSPASTPSVIPMQAPDIAGIAQSAVDIIKTPSEIDKNRATVKESLASARNLNAQADLSISQKIYQDIVNSREPDKIDATISSLLSQSHLGASQKIYYDALGDNIYNTTLDNVMASFFQYAGFDKDALEFQAEYDKFVQTLEHDASKLFNTLLHDSIGKSYEYGNVNEMFNKAVEDTFNRNFKGFDAKFAIQGNGLLPVSPSLNLGGSFNSDEGSSMSFVSGSNFVQRLQNHPAYDEFTKAIATSKLLKDAKTPQQRKIALLETKHLVGMVNSFTKLRNLVDVQNRLKNPSGKIPTYIPTQLPAPANEVY